MLAGRSSRALLVSVALLGLAGCPVHEPETRPFHLAVDVDGTPIGRVFDTEQLVRFSGTAIVEDAASLFIASAVLDGGAPLGDVRITFDPSALPDLAFPSQLGGNAVRVAVRVAPTGAGPRLEPLTAPGIRILLDGAPPVSQFLIWEGTYVRERAARVLSPAGLTDDETEIDFPVFFVEEQWIESEPGECGLVYYDNLVVGSPLDAVQAPATLLRRERTPFVVNSSLPSWTVAHVVSWHRDGACDGQSRVWTQFAAWRPPATP